MKRTNLVVIAAFLFAVLIASSFSFAQMERPRFKDRMQHDMKMEKLNLTEEQKDAIDKLHFIHKNEMIDLHANLEKKRLELNELKVKGNYTRAEFIAKIKAVSSGKQEMALAKANHRMDVYELLTEEQRKSFDDFREDSPGPRKEMRKHFRMRDRF